jgi:hypothetical protein
MMNLFTSEWSSTDNKPLSSSEIFSAIFRSSLSTPLYPSPEEALITGSKLQILKIFDDIAASGKQFRPISQRIDKKTELDSTGYVYKREFSDEHHRKVLTELGAVGKYPEVFAHSTRHPGSWYRQTYIRELEELGQYVVFFAGGKYSFHSM